MHKSDMGSKKADYKLLAGINKKSFEIYYHGGSIWAEHLDGMGNQEELVIKKFTEDSVSFCRPSGTSFMVINLDETVISSNVAACIIGTISETPKQFKKIAFVGVRKKEQRLLNVIQQRRGILVSFFSDYEKAKEWLLP